MEVTLAAEMKFDVGRLQLKKKKQDNQRKGKTQYRQAVLQGLRKVKDIYVKTALIKCVFKS